MNSMQGYQVAMKFQVDLAAIQLVVMLEKSTRLSSVKCESFWHRLPILREAGLSLVTFVKAILISSDGYHIIMSK